MNQRKLLFFTGLMVLIAIADPIFTDKILLKDNSVINGKIEKETRDYLIVTYGEDSFKKIFRSDIDSVIYTEKKVSETENDQKSNTEKLAGFAFFEDLDFKGFTGYSGLGLQRLNVNSLNSELKNHGFTGFEKNYLAVAGGGYLGINRMVFGGEGSFLLREPVNSTKGATTYSGILTGFDLEGYMGFMLTDSPYLDLFPYAGFGGGGLNLFISEKKTGNFSEQLSSPGQSIVFTSGAVIIKGGIHLIGKLPILSFKSTRAGILFGLQGGYKYAVYQSDWASGGPGSATKADGGPTNLINGFYAMINIGAWAGF